MPTVRDWVGRKKLKRRRRRESTSCFSLAAGSRFFRISLFFAAPPTRSQDTDFLRSTVVSLLLLSVRGRLWRWRVVASLAFPFFRVCVVVFVLASSSYLWPHSGTFCTRKIKLFVHCAHRVPGRHNHYRGSQSVLSRWQGLSRNSRCADTVAHGW